MPQAPSKLKVMDNFSDVKHVNVTFGANSTTLVTNSWNTGLTARSKIGYFINKVSIGPNDPSDKVDLAASPLFEMQIYKGAAAAAMLNRDDARLILAKTLEVDVATAVGFKYIIWPIEFAIGKLLTNVTLTCALQCSTDHAALQTKVWTFTIEYMKLGMDLMTFLEEREQTSEY